PSATSYSDAGLAAATTYSYEVIATNAAGDSAPSNVAKATTQAATQPPAAPSNLTATAASSSQVNLTWADNSGNETGFKVERAAPGGSFVQVALVGASVTAYSDTGLAAGTQYSYRVRATNAAGDSAYSNTASATTLAAQSAGPVTGLHY